MTTPLKPGIYRYDSVPRGAYTFAFGGAGYAMLLPDGRWFAHIRTSGLWEGRQSGRVVIDGEWHPREGDFSVVYHIGDCVADVDRCHHAKMTWAPFLAALARLGVSA